MAAAGRKPGRLLFGNYLPIDLTGYGRIIADTASSGTYWSDKWPEQFPLHEKTIQFEATNGALMIYEATPERAGYAEAPDWKKNMQDIVRDIIAHVRQEQR